MNKSRATKVLESLKKLKIYSSLNTDFLIQVKKVCDKGFSKVSVEFKNDKKLLNQVKGDIANLIKYASNLEKTSKSSKEYIGSKDQFEYNKLKSALSKLNSEFSKLPEIK